MLSLFFNKSWGISAWYHSLSGMTIDDLTYFKMKNKEKAKNKSNTRKVQDFEDKKLSKITELVTEAEKYIFFLIPNLDTGNRDGSKTSKGSIHSLPYSRQEHSPEQNQKIKVLWFMMISEENLALISSFMKEFSFFCQLRKT